MSQDHTHTSHPAITRRLKRAEGHLRSVIGMIESGRTCLEISQQLQAVERAITNAKRELIHDHVDHCLSDGTDRSDLKAITKLL